MTVKIVSKQRLVEQSIQQRLERVERAADNDQKRIVMQSLESGIIPHAQYPEGFDIRQYVRTKEQGANVPAGVIAEFVGTGNFASQFYERMRYEVDAGRDEEPLLYLPIYAQTIDASLPRMIKIYTLGTTGVIFEEITEGGEVKFATVGQGNKSVEIKHYGVGLEYSEDLFIYNELFRLANLERNFGVAHNALLNHIHMNPILSYSYGSANQTDGTSLTSFRTDAKMPEKYLRTIEQAIINGSTDTSNPRRGPYALLVSTADIFTVERALNRVGQEGFDSQSSALGRVQSVIAYDGWTGTRGKKSVTYSGVSSGTAYLIDLSNRTMDYQSYVKTPLRMQMGNEDISRFIMAQTVWDTRFGAFADPVRSVEEITWPMAASGSSS